MRRLLVPLFSGLAGVAFLIRLLTTTTPAAGQSCAVIYDFDAGIPTPWLDAGVSWGGYPGFDGDIGEMVIQQPAWATITADEIIQDMGLGSGGIISTPVYITATAKVENVSPTAGHMWYTYTNGVGESRQVWGDLTYTTRTTVLLAQGGALLDSISFGYYTYTNRFYVDHIVIDIDCAQITVDDPAAAPKPTPPPGLLTPVPTPADLPTFTIYTTNSIGSLSGTKSFVLPPPVVWTDTITQEFEMDWLWDVTNLSDMVSIVRTFPVLVGRYSMIRIIVALLAMILSVRFVAGFVAARTNRGSD